MSKRRGYVMPDPNPLPTDPTCEPVPTPPAEPGPEEPPVEEPEQTPTEPTPPAEPTPTPQTPAEDEGVTVTIKPGRRVRSINVLFDYGDSDDDDDDD